MTYLKTFIVDDEPDACRLLQNLLHVFDSLLVTRTFNESLKALDVALAEKPDVIFLDIDMPELNGIEFLKQLNNHSPKSRVVFVSAYGNYALDAIQNCAYDFITKPVCKQELRRVVHRLVADDNSSYDVSQRDCVLLKTSEGYHYLTAENVLFFEAEGNYTKIYMQDESILFSSINMGRIFEQFPQQLFLRISRKHIVNKNYLTFLNFSKKECTLSVNKREHKLEVSLKLKDIKAQL